MGCDDQKQHTVRVSYCKPACKELKIVPGYKTCVAECVRCSLHHEFNLVAIDGKWEIRVKA